MTLAVGPNLGQLENGDPGEAHYAELMRQWRALDALIQLNVISRVAALPTSGQVNGDKYLLTATGNINKIARWSTRLITPAWEYFTPNAGWSAWVVDEVKRYTFSGGAWAVESGGGGVSLSVVQAFAGAKTLGLSDINTYNVSQDATAQAVTLPAQATVAWTDNAEITVERGAAGAVTIVGAAGVVINGVTAGTFTLSTQYSVATLKRKGSNLWTLFGNAS